LKINFRRFAGNKKYCIPKSISGKEKIFSINYIIKKRLFD